MPEYILEDRLKAVMKKMGVSQAEMARRLGIAPESLGKYLADSSVKGKRNPEMLVTKLSSIGISLDWYVAGKGTMFLDDVQDKSSGESESEEAIQSQAKVIQLMFDRGLVKIPSAVSQPEVQTENKGCCTCEDCFEVPLYVHRVAAGLPADSTCQAEKISLPAILVKHPNDTYAVTVSGDSMTGAGIEEGDILVVDRAVKPSNKSIVIASINGEQTVKRLKIKKGEVSLMPENHKYLEIPITPEMDFRTLGVVMWMIRKTC
jgi:DNA polymerase V